MTRDEKAHEICRNLKYKYIFEHSKLPECDKTQELINLVIDLDYQDDMNWVRMILRDEDVNLESWLLFKGAGLRWRWDEVTGLIKERMGELMSGNTLQEMIDFIRRNMDDRENNVFT